MYGTGLGGSGTARIGVVSEGKVGGTERRELQTSLGVGGTGVEGSGTAWIGVESEEEVGGLIGKRFRLG